MVELILEVLQGLPVWLFLAALSLLPLLGMPLSPMWILTGLIYGVWGGLGLIIVGMAINFALAYLISQRWLRVPVSRLLLRKGYRIPEAKPGEFIKLTLAIRLIPVLPQFMQSYLLGLANVPFHIYYFYSFPPQIAYAVGFVILGDSLLSMKGGGVILGVSIVIAVALLLNIARKRQTVLTSKDELKP